MDFELSHHAQTSISEREIELVWVERVIENPALREEDRSDPEVEHLLGPIEEFGNRILRVVLNRTTVPRRVVTVYFDRRKKGSL